MSYSQEDAELVLERIRRSNGVVTPQSYFVQVPNCFIRNKDLSANEKLMYIYLWGFGGESMNSYPGQGRMSKELGWSKPTIINVLKKLEESGGVYIISRKFRNTNEKATNLYYLAEINTQTGNFIKSSLSMVKQIYPDKFAYIG